MPDLKITNNSTGEGSSGSNTEILLSDMPARELMVVMDKVFAGNETIVEEAGIVRSSFKAFDKYKEALSTPSAESIVKEDDPDFESHGLDLKDFDIRKPGDLIELLKDLLEDAELKVNTGKGPDDKRNLYVQLNMAGRTFQFNADDLKNFDPSNAVSTGLESEEDKGAELIADNGTFTSKTSKGFIKKFRATNDGDDDTLSNDNRNILTQTKSAFVLTSILDANVNAGLNGTIAIFIA